MINARLQKMRHFVCSSEAVSQKNVNITESCTNVCLAHALEGSECDLVV